jgi:hemolysin III
MIPHVANILQIADHIAIYLLIAGSYTPFVMIGLHGSAAGTVMLICEWLAALVGIAFSMSCDLALK